MEETFYLTPSRIPVFIGREGAKKKEFEEYFSCSIDINSESGEVKVEAEDAVNSFILGSIIDAINLGHNPENTFYLKDEHIVFDVIDVRQQVRDSKRLSSVIGRIIGKEGSTRKAIEEITKCNLAITEDGIVSFIGPFENIQLIYEALEMLIQGASHKSVYSYLERNKI